MLADTKKPEVKKPEGETKTDIKVDEETKNKIKGKAKNFDTRKEQEKERIRLNIKFLKEKLDSIETKLLEDLDAEFGENVFSEFLSKIVCGNYRCSAGEVDAILSREIPGNCGPDEDSFCLLLKEIESFGSRQKKKENKINPFSLVPKNLKCLNKTCDTISVCWDNVICDYYEIKLEPLSSTKTICYSREPKHVFCELKPGTEYRISVRSVLFDKSIKSMWSEPIVVQTERKFANCTWKKCPDDVDGDMEYSVDEKNPRVATKINDGVVDYCAIIGNASIPPNKVISWSIKVLKSENNGGGGILIGIAPNDIDQNVNFDRDKCGWYFYCGSSVLYSGPPHNYYNKEYGPRKGTGEYVHTGDSVGVVIDTTKGKLSFVLDGVNLGVAFEGIPLDKPLVPCVILCFYGDSVELII